uniref:Uncharacterized protein n=1 Tax=Ascaris lumbricoides TaxID=6252 RepID=A0A0M3I8U3_ASCLU
MEDIVDRLWKLQKDELTVWRGCTAANANKSHKRSTPRASHQRRRIAKRAMSKKECDDNILFGNAAFSR